MSSSCAVSPLMGMGEWDTGIQYNLRPVHLYLSIDGNLFTSRSAATMAFLGFHTAVDKAERSLKFAGEPKFSRRSILSGFPDGRISILAVHL